MTVRHEFGGMREAGDIIGALGFPRLRLWDCSSMCHLTSNVDFDAFFDGTVGALPVLTASEELETAHVNKLLKQLCKGAKEVAVR